MPRVGDKMLTPEEAIAKALCPECGAGITEKSAKPHALSHWPETIKPLPTTQEARRRQALLVGFKEKGGKP